MEKTLRTLFTPPVGAKRKSRHKRGRSETKIPLSGSRSSPWKAGIKTGRWYWGEILENHLNGVSHKKIL
ncbi:MAG: hypothetical protein MUO88_19885 [Desulfobacterales bacterium]|nr:hypothetical protein [Desulfobacterales bacterium]